MDVNKVLTIYIIMSFLILMIFAFLFVWLFIQYQHNVMKQQLQEINRLKKKEYDQKKDHGPITHVEHIQRPMPMINIATQPYNRSFKQVGVLFSNETAEEESRHVLPLFGRRLHTRSDRWYYYTLTNGFREIKLSVHNNSKDCLNEYGCHELQSGDVIQIPQYKTDFKVSLYERNQFIYDPNTI